MSIRTRCNLALTLIISLFLTASRGEAEGIPEPSLVMYGVIRIVNAGGSARLTTGALTWIFKPSAGGQTVTVTTPLTNINDQFSYVLRVPCESPLPGFTLSADTLQLSPAPTTYDRSQVMVDGTTQASFVTPTQATLTLSSQDRGRIERVDLQLSAVFADSDGDGLPDAWERQYLHDMRFGPNDDVDKDGLSNLAEYKAGTNPNDANSCFAFINIEPETRGGILVEWSSVEGKSYLLQRSSNLANFSTIESHIPATAPLNSYRDATALGAGPFFYRLQVE
ncbi:MAG: thrombospondin type 3 repeat-containing protein [Verrucomicrobiia bacterium]